MQARQQGGDLESLQAKHDSTAAALAALQAKHDSTAAALAALQASHKSATAELDKVRWAMSHSS